MGLEALSGQADQLRNRAQVPVGAGWANVSEVRRQQWDSLFDVGAILVPVHERSDGKGVSQIVNCRPLPRRAWQAGFAQETDMTPTHVLREEPGAFPTDEEAGAARLRDNKVTPIGIAVKCIESRWVQVDLTGLSEFRMSHDQ